MARWRKIAMIAAAVGATFAWARLDPGAGKALSGISAPAALVSLLTGKPKGEAQGPANPAAARAPGEAMLIVTAPVGQARINDSVSAIGDGEALRSVTLVPQSPGIVAEIAAMPGQSVEAGAVLVRLDARSERIARDKAALDLRLAEEKLKRIERLVATNAASEVQLAETRIEADRAQLAVAEAELALARRDIVAPFGGIVGLVPVGRGDYVTAGTALLTIDDRSAILVDFWVPERFAGMVGVGQPVDAEAIAMPLARLSGSIAEIASRIDRNSRTLQVRARLDNPGDRLRAGMSFRIAMRFEGEERPAVDPLAIQWSSQGPFVWKVVGGKAERTPVTILQRNADAVLVAGRIAAGDHVAVEGTQTLRHGAAVRSANPAAGT